MRNLIILLFTCVCAFAQAQVNFVKNPSFEEYTKCPDMVNQIKYAKYWTDAIDTLSPIDSDKSSEYFNACANGGINKIATTPENGVFYQYCRTGDGMVGGTFYYDKILPNPISDDTNFREYIQGRLAKALAPGKQYCVSFWVNLAEGSGYAQNKIGAYLDNGSINSLPVNMSTEILTVKPQVFTNWVIEDTANWVKIEGSFTANGTETHITLGNFFPNSATSVKVTNYWLASPQISGYLIDDVSVIPIDLDVQAGPDTWVEQGAKRKIGRLADSATAMGLDCKWYHKGILIDSGAIITVNASSVKGTVDTYVVVQTICGVVKSDTVLVRTVGAGIREYGFTEQFALFPNPSNGSITIHSESSSPTEITIHVYDLLGRDILKQRLNFTGQQAKIDLPAVAGSYILELRDEVGNVQRERIVVQ